MRDISAKVTTLRTAVAEATLALSPKTLGLIRAGEIPKGDPLEVARVAAIQAAKQTSSIIPYCHPLPLDFAGVEFDLGEDRIRVTVTVKAIYKTGVEMEALCGASVAALTLYDMLKMLDDTLEILSVRLLSKKGGKSDFKKDSGQGLRAAVLVIADPSAGSREEDAAAELIEKRLLALGFAPPGRRTVPAGLEEVAGALRACADEQKLDLVLTAGGTSSGGGDIVPDAMSEVIGKEIPGIAEALRAYARERGPLSMFSRVRAGLRGKTIIVNLPGDPQGAEESLSALFPGLLHAFRMLRGEKHAQGHGEEK